MAEFSTTEIAQHFGIDPKNVTKLIRQEHLKGMQQPDTSVPIGHRWMVVAESMEAIGAVIKENCPRLARRMNGETPMRSKHGNSSTKMASLLARKDDFLPLEDVAKALGKNSTTLYGFLSREKVTTVKVGGRAFLDRPTIEKLRIYYTPPPAETVSTPTAKANDFQPAAMLSVRLNSIEQRLINRSIAFEEKVLERIEQLAKEIDDLAKTVKAVFAQLGGDVH